MLTKREKQILDAIEDYISTNRFSPSIRKLCELVVLKSSSTVHKHLRSLEDRTHRKKRKLS